MGFGFVMRLKSLKLAGFKSFANPTTFTFKHDITAIVGPNGCGKSNVIDAIRWVLGETSAKQLRGGAMSDVIFAGVEGRAAKSLASVELVFEHTQDETHGIRHELNLYQELSLRRQVTKEGKSDYFINGQRVRRRDVVDVFLGTGLGARSYAVIEQGMIGRIVESSPMQLREFIEEGAGVSRYQARRAETEKKLAETKENLDRLSDLQGELKKQHKTLQRQAESAKQYEALSAELARLNYEDLLRRLFEAWQYHELKKGEQGKFGDELGKLEQNVNKVRRELDELSARVAEGQWLKDEARDKYHNAQMAEQTAQHNFYTVNSQISQHEEKISRLTVQHKDALANIEQANQELASIADELKTITPDVQKSQTALQHAKDELEKIQKEWQDKKDALSVLTGEQSAFENQQKLAQAQIVRIEQNQQKWQKKSAELQQMMSALQIDQMAEATLAKQTAEIESLTLRLSSFDDEEELKNEVAKLSDKITKTQQENAQKDKQHASLMGEYEILHKLVHSPGKSVDKKDTDGVQSLSTLKDGIALSKKGEQYAEILDAFLGVWLDARLTDDLPLSALTTHPDEVTAMLYAADVSSEQVDFADLLAVQDLIKQPKLSLFARCYLYVGEDLPALTKWLQSQTGVLVLTQAGWILGGFGAVHISHFGAENSQFLQERQVHIQRLDELEGLLSAIEDEQETAKKQLKAEQSRLDTLKISLEEMTAQRTSLTAQLHQLEQAKTRLVAQMQTWQIQQENFAKNRASLDEEFAEMNKELNQLKNDEQAAKERLTQILPRIDEAKQGVGQMEKLIDAKNTTLKQLVDDHQALQLKLNALTQSQSHAQRLQEMANHSVTQTQVEIASTEAMLESLTAKVPELEQVFKQAKITANELKIISDEHEQAMKTLQFGQSKLQETLNEAHAAFANAQAAAAQLTAETAVGESRLQDLGDELVRLDEKFNLPATLADFRHNPNRTFVDNSEQRQTVKQQIIKLGAVNLAAAAELAELESRVSPMDEQIGDIVQSMNKLQDAIKAIDEKTKSLFLTALSAVNKELNALFSKVFGGGQASLTLMEDDSLSKADKWRAGLVLMAQPKGKKNSRLAVLSGGEKTLTALSLIFAIFKQHPAPFCVLDEVDAPLDDANVGRFTGLIHELADDVQFIFISHNKLAMQIAHELKGITMPTAGISSLVTVNLEEAEKYLEPAGGMA